MLQLTSRLSSSIVLRSSGPDPFVLETGLKTPHVVVNREASSFGSPTKDVYKTGRPLCQPSKTWCSESRADSVGRGAAERPRPCTILHSAPRLTHGRRRPQTAAARTQVLLRDGVPPPRLSTSCRHSGRSCARPGFSQSIRRGRGSPPDMWRS